MTILQKALFLLVLGTAGQAFAICGDVNGDAKRSTLDALLVLRSAVGQNVNLTCEDSGPSRLRYYNDFTCGDQTSQAKFNGFTFVADGGDVSPYQTVDRTEITNIELKVCGGTYTFSGPLNLPPNRSLTFLMVLLDPEIYDGGDGVPAYFVIEDDGEAATADVAMSMDRSSNIVTVLKGTGRRTAP
jgi:hypothetical protein